MKPDVFAAKMAHAEKFIQSDPATLRSRGQQAGFRL
jgi:hypothetical protein